MTTTNSTPERPDDENDMSGAYVLDALGPEERASFETRLRESDDLRAEVVSLSDTAVELGLAVAPEAPSPALRANILASIAGMPQLPAETAQVSAADTTDAAPAAAGEVLAPTERAQARWFRHPAVALAAAAAAIVLAFSGGLLVDRGAVDLEAQQIAEITAASDFQRASVPLDGGGHATLVWSGELGRSALIAEGMGELPSDQTYELWYLRDGQAIPAGTFTMEGDTVTVVLEGVMHAGDAVGVTIEPAGGSETPSTDPIVVLGA
ncbi:anti-sigma factor [uncultured Schumannella sp.]|uniref:anti-sigma factor n=1 Tax=uncultured Schumannella sp. TaxID=1195956 RepID=UPI0025F72072|nr:anti-sigma factor [uncultured Schumannella sp.]